MVAPGIWVLTFVRRRGNNGKYGKEWQCHSKRKFVAPQRLRVSGGGNAIHNCNFLFFPCQHVQEFRFREVVFLI
jgi:hypothetical protein